MDMIKLSRLRINPDEKFVEIIGNADIRKDSIESFREYQLDYNVKIFSNIEEMYELEDQGKLEDYSFPTQIKLVSGECIYVAEMAKYIKEMCNEFIPVLCKKESCKSPNEASTEIVFINPEHILAVKSNKKIGETIISLRSSEVIFTDGSDDIAKRL